jgi:hypothetical protein
MGRTTDRSPGSAVTNRRQDGHGNTIGADAGIAKQLGRQAK